MNKQIKSVEEEEQAWLRLQCNKTQHKNTKPLKGQTNNTPQKFHMSDQLQQTLSGHNEPHPTRLTGEFTFADILALVNNYIHAYHYIHIEPRNMQIIHCTETPLEYIFNVSAFHTSQLPNLLLPHITSTEDVA